MAAQIWVNDNGAPQRLRQIWVNDAGTPRRLRQIWVNDNGTPRLIYTQAETFEIGPLFGESSGFTRFETDGTIVLGIFSGSGVVIGEFPDTNNWIDATGLSSDAEVRAVRIDPPGNPEGTGFLSLNVPRQIGVSGAGVGVNVRIRYDFRFSGEIIVSAFQSAGFGGFG